MPAAPRTVVFQSPVLNAESIELQVGSFSSREALSTIDEVMLELWQHAEQPIGDATLRSLPGSPASIAWAVDADQIEDAWFGIVQEVEILTPVSPGYYAYRMVLASPLHLLLIDRLSRVFQDMSVPEIVKKVLVSDYGRTEGTHFEMRLTGTYPKRTYTVQYEESTFAFLSRLMEHDGIFHFTQATDAGPRIVFADDNAAFEPVPGHESIPYSTGEMPGSIGGLRRTYRLGPGHVVLRDYNSKTPATVVQGSAPVDPEDGHGVGLRMYYGDHFKDSGEGKKLAKIRAEELACAKHQLTGSGRLPFLHPGQTFTLANHPLPDLDGHEYLVTSVWHHISQAGTALGGTGGGGESEGHRCEFTLQPKSLPFRPARRAPRPYIPGLLHAHVDGGSSSTATPVGTQGEYKVRMPIDTVATGGGVSSRWVRRAQPYSGFDYGMHFPLHIGTEVTIAHVHGDPDRPIILGAVPNAQTPPPVAEDNPTQSAIKTHGGIVVQFEDDA